MRRILVLLCILALVTWWFAAGDEEARQVVPPSGPFACTVAGIADGDSLRCREQGPDGHRLKVRLSGISAREPDGSCQPGHPCTAASADAAKAELSRLAEGQRLVCRPVGVSYDRVAAFCRRGDGTDLSCAMVASGTAARWDRHWGRHNCA